MRLIVYLLCFWICLAAVGAESYRFRGELVELEVRSVGDRRLVYLDSPGVQKLLQSTLARFQRSSSGLTLYVYLPGLETSWTDGLGVYTRNGVEVSAPGSFFAQGDQGAMELPALLEALALTPVKDAQGWKLLGRVLKVEPASASSMELKVLTSAAVKHKAIEVDSGCVRLELPDTAWDAGPTRFRLGEAQVEVQPPADAEAPLRIDFRYLPFWAPRVKVGFTRELLISPEPRSFVSQAETARLLSVKEVAGEGWEFTLDQPRQFFWAYDSESRQFRLAFPATTSELAEVRGLRTESYPVVQWERQLAQGEAFEFYQRSDEPRVLLLKCGPRASLKPADFVGTALMAGLQGGRGKIVIDPGHGGGDPGCRNRELGVYEKDVTLDISLRLMQILQAQGWQVELTRTTDRDVTYAGSPDLMELQARADVANRMGADIFVSIHCNASISPAVRGSSIYWYKSQDRPLAECLDLLDASLGFEQDGLIQNNFAVLRLTSMPAVLVETAFLTNPVEGRLLANPKIRQGIAERLAQGLGEYMGRVRSRSSFRP